jgi:hypothetical protein
MYQLKKGQEAFTVVEGPFKGRSFKPGQLYAEIPPQEARKFTGTGTDLAKVGTDFKSVPKAAAKDSGTDLKSVPEKPKEGRR